MRSGEIRSLRVGQLDWKARSLRVGKAKTRAGTGREIPMNDDLAEILSKQVVWLKKKFEADLQPDWHLFPFSNRVKPVNPLRPATTIKSSWESVRTTAKVQCRLHDLRHTALTKMAEDNARRHDARTRGPHEPRDAGALLAHPDGSETRGREIAGPPEGGELAFEWQRSPRGPSMVRAIEFSVPSAQAPAFSKARLRVTWDGRGSASIDAPIAVFYGAGILYNRDGREYLVKSFPMVVRYGADRVYLSCYFPMPLFRSARMELTGAELPIADIEWKVRLAPYRDPPNNVGYFHATYRDHPTPEPGRDLVLLDTTRTEGGGDWSGQFVGTSFIFSHAAVLNTLEGDPRFFFDDSSTPQAQGTGTEEWGGGGDYWGGENMTLLFAGHPTGARNAQAAVSDEDKTESAYRFLLADLMPFGKNTRIQLEHGGINESTQHFETVTYWYGLPAPALIRTDDLMVGDLASERQHDYRSPDASAPYEIVSRYEWGPDTLQGREIYPAETDRGRTTKTASEFTLRIDPGNFGVMLRRKLDYAFPNQRAEVFVAAVTPGRPAWKAAGVWYLAGSNTCVFSSPRQELGAAEHVVQTSNRRFRDDEFLLPLALTQGRKAIRVRVKFTPVSRPLYPGYPLPELAWSEIRYTAYSFVMPKFRLKESPR